jgi:very-short-patch-repair endonuclease
VYLLWTAPASQARWQQRLMASALWLGDIGAVSHRSALIAWNLDGLRRAPIELSTIRFHHSEADLILHRVQPFDADEVTLLDGMRITSVNRTLLDLCAVVPRVVVEQALESALRLRLTDPETLRSYVERQSGRRRRASVLRDLLRDMPDRVTESALEAVVWALSRENGLPLPQRQHEVRTETGVLIGRVDFAYPQMRIAIEADGYAFHSSRRDWRRDRERQNALVRLGWTVYRVTWEDATYRAPTVTADIASLIRRAADARK